MLRQGILSITQPVPADCLALQLRELARHGLEEILLLLSGVEKNHEGWPPSLPGPGMKTQLPLSGAGPRCVLRQHVLEPEAGSAGGLAAFQDQLDAAFLFRDAGLFFDINCLEVGLRLADAQPGACAARPLTKGYGGTLVLRRESLAFVASSRDDMEADLLPRLREAGRLAEPVFDRPCHTLADAAAWPRSRPAVFFDRDGVLNKDTGFVYRLEDFEWTPGAIEAVKFFNDRGWLVFVVTNQSGVARGYYPESAVGALHDWMQRDLGRFGAHVDAFYYCPYYAKGSIPAYAREHPDRKPSPGMVLRALESWPVRLRASMLIGDKASDMETARRAGMPGFRFAGGNLAAFVRAVLEARIPADTL